MYDTSFEKFNKMFSYVFLKKFSFQSKSSQKQSQKTEFRML